MNNHKVAVYDFNGYKIKFINLLSIVNNKAELDITDYLDYFDEVYENDKWVAITENKFEGTGEDIKATLTDLRRTFHDVPSDITNEEFFETQDRYAARKYKVTVTVSTQ